MNPSAVNAPLGLDLKTAAAKCGLSVKTLTRAIKSGELTVAKFGRAIRVPVSELSRWFASHLVRPSDNVCQNRVKKKVKRTGADTN